MYRKPSPQLTIDGFILPLSGKLDAKNRWVQLANIIPWDEYEKEYAHMFRVPWQCRQTNPHGARYVNHPSRCGYTKRETGTADHVEFLSSMVHLPQRVSIGSSVDSGRPGEIPQTLQKDHMAQINERITLAEQAAKASEKEQKGKTITIMSMINKGLGFRMQKRKKMSHC